MPARFLTVPHIQQKSDADCLAACAAMMLEFAGFRTNYNQILRLLDMADFGTPHSRIQRLSRLYADLHITYREGWIEDIIYFLDHGYPVAIFVYTGELPYWSRSTYHAVIVVGYTDNNFYLHDPAFRNAPQVVSHGDLQLAWDAFGCKFAVMQRR